MSTVRDIVIETLSRAKADMAQVGIDQIVWEATERIEALMPQGREVEEWGVQRTLPQWNDGEPFMEWGASVGMTHRYDYTAESVWSLCGGNPVYHRIRTIYPDRLSEPERVTRP